jgi:hypothetical protein
LVSKSSEGLDLKAYSRELDERRLSTIYDLTGKLPEQMLERAWRKLPVKKGGMHFILGCKGRRQKFGVDDRGVVFIPKRWNVRLKGRYSDRFLWDGDAIAYALGLPEKEPEERRLEQGFLPILYARWIEDGIVYEQETFTTLLLKNLLEDLKDEGSIDGDDPVVCMVRITVTSQSLTRKRVRLQLSSTIKKNWRERVGEHEKLVHFAGLIFAEPEGVDAVRKLRFMLDINDKGLVQTDRGLA